MLPPYLDRRLCGERERLLLLSLSRDRLRSRRLLSLSREVDLERRRSYEKKKKKEKVTNFLKDKRLTKPEILITNQYILGNTIDLSAVTRGTN